MSKVTRLDEGVGAASGAHPPLPAAAGEATNVQAIVLLPPESRLGRVTGTVWRFLLPVLTIFALVGVWWLAVLVMDWPPYVVPSPADVWNEFLDKRELLPEHVWTTLGETLQGYLLAIAIAVPVAVMIAYSRFLEATIYPALVALNAIPKIAIAPIFIIWMGFGPGPKIAIVVLICFFPIVIATATGLKSTPDELVELVRSLSASPIQQFFKVRLPASLPYVFVGLKVGITLAVIGAVVGEFVGATEGSATSSSPRVRTRTPRSRS
ncbi:MAG: ABC transporter permease [Gaiella sp.]|nr:ABC transporter permease [Gaiella sp.]